MDAKRLAIVLGITVLLPLFLALFVDALYAEPKYENYCTNQYPQMYKEPSKGVNCTDMYQTPEAQQCSKDKGNPIPKYDSNSCQIFDKCDYCQKDFNQGQMLYNRNTFFILAPIGLAVVILGIFLTVEYIGAGFMFGGLITMFYATVRYFSDMSKMLRAIVILVELLIIVWIAYKKIERTDNVRKKESTGSTKKKSR